MFPVSGPIDPMLSDFGEGAVEPSFIIFSRRHLSKLELGEF